VKSLITILFIIISNSIISQTNLKLRSKIYSTIEYHIVVWKLDWVDKKIVKTPMRFRSKEGHITINLQYGDYSIDYRIDDVQHSIYNLHIDEEYNYHKYLIYSTSDSICKIQIDYDLLINHNYMKF
jgi:uncharacterized protein involved in high-affinity Fe2+ transport